MAVIDVHTHMLTEEYLAFLSANSGPKYERKPTKAGQDDTVELGQAFQAIDQPLKGGHRHVGGGIGPWGGSSV